MKNISNCKFDLYFFNLKININYIYFIINMSFGVRYAPTINEQSYTYNLITSLSLPVSGTGGAAPAPSQTGYAYTIDFDTNYTQKLKSIIINKNSTINTNDISCTLNTLVGIQQIYTIGKSIQSTWVAVGSGTNTIAYSTDNGESWNGLGTTIFGAEGLEVCWNGELWVATGTSPGSIAYSNNGINWTPVTSSPLVTGVGVAWNGSMFVAVGGGGVNTICWSNDGTVWTGVGKSIFSHSGNGVAWNGALWVAVGEGQDNIATSIDGTNWTGVGKSIFSHSGNGVAWNGDMWVAVGQGDNNNIAYSSNGTSWVALESVTVFSFSGGVGRGVAWNGEIWVAVGEASNTIAWSNNGLDWTGLGNTIFSDSGNGVSWNGNIFIAVGQGTNTIATSKDGKIWSPVIDSSAIFSVGSGVACNSARDINMVIEGGSRTSTVITPNETISLNKGDKLDIFAPLYYNNGYNSATITINSSFV